MIGERLKLFFMAGRAHRASGKFDWLYLVSKHNFLQQAQLLGLLSALRTASARGHGKRG
jgi:hypothetical protein